ncbi:short-chain fatty acid transporter [Endozoicomonas atrinae]|uniref:short-chain fatty acid transporter n=1 Tax=Endozoicomonas atrinae TaxID=1333660 RepID=UPI000824FD16|nr:short-chain fatty acid transporter [Endozoicomonas atrinae]
MVALTQELKQQNSLLQRFSGGCVALVQKYLPDPFIFAALLTLFVFLMAMPMSSQGPMAMVNAWAGGFWGLLEFAMQMALVVVTGHAMASAPVFKRGLSHIAGMAKTPTQAIYLVSFISALACLINWGFGLVIGALFARELAARVKNVDYRLLIASAYSGFLFWHGGLSGSVPLSIATDGNLAKVTQGAITGIIPTSQTMFSFFNLAIIALLLLVIPLLNRAMHPSADQVFVIDPELLKEDHSPEKPVNEMTPAERIENSKALSLLLGVMGYAFIIGYFVRNGFALNLNIVNFVFLFTAIILHGTPRRLLDAVFSGARNTAGILLQFPFYAGIMGMMTAAGPEGSSVASVISDWFVSISNETTFPLFTFLSAGIVNFFVPSGGGQWAVQAPIMMPAGLELGVDSAKTAMAIAWGDAWTNMIQPFWALPALGIAGLGAKDIMGYCLVVLIASGVIICAGMTFF